MSHLSQRVVRLETKANLIHTRLPLLELLRRLLTLDGNHQTLGQIDAELPAHVMTFPDFIATLPEADHATE